MMLPPKIAIASGNKGKINEINNLFRGLNIQLLSQLDLDISEAEEPHYTFMENALSKARHVSKNSGLPALADDSGICVYALNGQPGVRSARFAGNGATDTQNSQHLVDLMRHQTDRRAYFYCVLILVRHHNDPAPLVTDGRWYGELAREFRGDEGFGSDPVFLDPKMQLTGSEMTTNQKNELSHRGEAVRKMKLLLESGAF